MQYGLIGTSTALNCTTTLNEREFVITTDWYSGSGITGTQLPRRPHFNRTSISDEGTFTCSVFIAQMNIRINKIITFSVVGKLTHSKLLVILNSSLVNLVCSTTTILCSVCLVTLNTEYVAANENNIYKQLILCKSTSLMHTYI